MLVIKVSSFDSLVLDSTIVAKQRRTHWLMNISESSSWVDPEPRTGQSDEAIRLSLELELSHSDSIQLCQRSYVGADFVEARLRLEEHGCIHYVGRTCMRGLIYMKDL